jgi:uncharacterized Zn finger protein
MAAPQVLGDAQGMNRAIARILRRVAARQGMSGRLIYCPSCGSAYVNPVEWRERDELRWWMRLRCGECGFVREVVVSNEEAAFYESDLDHGVAKIASAVARLDRERMIAESDALTAALERDLIDPGDFRR